jgi:hypothetical protein
MPSPLEAKARSELEARSSVNFSGTGMTIDYFGDAWPIDYSDDAWIRRRETARRQIARLSARTMVDQLRNCLREGSSGRDEWNGRRQNSAWGLEALPRPLTVTLADNVSVSLAPPNLWLADLRGEDLSGYDLSGAFLGGAILQGARLRDADLSGAHLIVTDLRGCDLRNANLSRANLLDADLADSNMSNSVLSGALMLRTNIANSVLDHSNVHGVSTWGLSGVPKSQTDLTITTLWEPTITVDNIQVAQFIYLLLHNEKIRDIIDTIGKKGVLLLGRFTEGRIAVLERLREKLRGLGYVPMVFNFDKPETKDFTETIRLLANLSHFVIVDITNPRSTPLELQAAVPDYMVPFAPILQDGEEPFAMFVDLKNKYDWVLKDVIVYPSIDRLIEVLQREIIAPAEAKFSELLSRRTRQLSFKKV